MRLKQIWLSANYNRDGPEALCKLRMLDPSQRGVSVETPRIVTSLPLGTRKYLVAASRQSSSGAAG